MYKISNQQIYIILLEGMSILNFLESYNEQKTKNCQKKLNSQINY
ncbi:hypothetical protein pb186bvf_003482 [Paramecium bursaria]